MDDRSEDESPYSISDDEETHELEIKPPQAKIAKHSHLRHSGKHSSSGRQVYVSSRRHHKATRHSRHHQEKRHAKEQSEVNRLVYAKKYDDRLPEHDEYRRKKAYESSRRSEKPKEDRHKVYYVDNEEDDYKMSERYREQDLREKIERRRHHHHRSEKEKVRSRQERYEVEVKKDPKKHRTTTDERKRRHREERKHGRSEKYRDDKEELEKNSRLSRKVPYSNREMVIDVETSPPVLREEYPDEKHDKHLEEGEVEDKESSNSSSESSSNSSGSNSSSSGSTTGSGSSNSSGENSSSGSSSENDDQEVEEGEKVVADVRIVGEKFETKPEELKETKDESSPLDNDETKAEVENALPSYFPAIQGCRSVEEFQCLNRIAEGTYGVVYRAREKRTDRIVALKRLKMEKEKEGFPITSLREINTLLKAQHPNIVTVREIVVGSNMDKIYIVMDYVEHDLKSLMETMKEKKMEFKASEIKCLMLQLLRAVNHLHDNWILHRDLKTSNLLFSHNGVLKVGDFGLAREYGSPLKHYTPVVVTLWYRAPELLLGSKEYSTSIDIWSVGCIFAEILRMEPLFPGKNELDQLNRIFKVLGTPNEKHWPEYSELPVPKNTQIPSFSAVGIRSKFKPKTLTELGYGLLNGLLMYNPRKRTTADLALQHEYFREHPLPIDPTMFRSWPAKSEFNKVKEMNNSPKPPSGGQNYKDLKEDDGFYIGIGEHPNPFSLKSTFCLKF